MVFSLARGASIVLYDGSPFYPTDDAILRHTAEEQATFIRLTPKYVETLMKSGINPTEKTRLFGALRANDREQLAVRRRRL